MKHETTGTVIAVQKQWWFKINTKPFRAHMWEGSLFPHIIKAQYTVNGQTYTAKKWLWPNQALPKVGSSVQVMYQGCKPSKANILI
ncbi:MAG: sugar ABC transporter permease [Clostridia bacterium]|nr:sugar ABC transporter permease [Clostridia bacterium]